jgi:hypothetical protein
MTFAAPKLGFSCVKALAIAAKSGWEHRNVAEQMWETPLKLKR